MLTERDLQVLECDGSLSTALVLPGLRADVIGVALAAFPGKDCYQRASAFPTTHEVFQ
jgi:hypothetical protein